MHLSSWIIMINEDETNISQRSTICNFHGNTASKSLHQTASSHIIMLVVLMYLCITCS